MLRYLQERLGISQRTTHDEYAPDANGAHTVNDLRDWIFYAMIYRPSVLDDPAMHRPCAWANFDWPAADFPSTHDKFAPTSFALHDVRRVRSLDAQVKLTPAQLALVSDPRTRWYR